MVPAGGELALQGVEQQRIPARRRDGGRGGGRGGWLRCGHEHKEVGFGLIRSDLGLVRVGCSGWQPMFGTEIA
eukprot:1824581-Rhodomonas_salina.2